MERIISIAVLIVLCSIVFYGCYYRKRIKSQQPRLAGEETPNPSDEEAKKLLTSWGIESYEQKAFLDCDRPWFLKRRLLTYEVLSDYDIICGIARKLGLTVFIKVRLIDLLRPQKEYFSQFIWAKWADFVLWSRELNRVVCIINISSHKENDTMRQRQRETFIRDTLVAAGYNYMSYSNLYPKALEQKITGYLVKEKGNNSGTECPN